MNRRGFYRHIAELHRLAASTGALLEQVTRAMRIRRDLEEGSPANDLPLNLDDDDLLGKIYQAINAPALERAYRATTRERRKFQADEIPAVTQLFTPRFVVEFLLHNTLGKLWRAMHPQSSLRFEYLLPNNIVAVQPRLLKEIRILDPACGTMNFGVVAIEMLQAMYREELAMSGPERGSVRSPNEISATILEQNLFGIDIDPAALDLAAQTLSMKLRLPVKSCRSNLLCGNALFDFDGPSSRRDFDIVVTNPPYLSARNLPYETVTRMKRHYPASWRDSCAAFIERSLRLARDGGYVGVLAMQSFMFTGSFQKLRKKVGEAAAIEAIAHFGPGLFDIGNPGTLQTAAVVMRREANSPTRDANEVVALRLVDADDKEAALRRAIHSLSPVLRGEGGGEGSKALAHNAAVSSSNGLHPSPPSSAPSTGAREDVFRILQHHLLSSPRRAWSYWLLPRIREIFTTSAKLRDISPPRQGLATTDNARFVRYWWEVEPTRADAPCRASPSMWFPYAKSGRFRRWYESPRHRVNWADDGCEIKQSIAKRYPYLNGRWKWVAKNSQFYGRAGVTYSYLTLGDFSARLMPQGTIFDVAGSALFPDDPLTILAILNSSTARYLLRVINPTVNFQVGDLAELPLPCSHDDELDDLAKRAIEVQRQLDGFDETSPDFIAPPAWRDGAEQVRKLNRELRDTERQIDLVTARLYDVPLESSEDSAEASISSSSQLARPWLSFAIGRLLGRWNQPQRINCLSLRPARADQLALIEGELTQLLGECDAKNVAGCAGGIEPFLARDFYAQHVKQHHRRPIYWAFGRRNRASLVLHDFATADVVNHLLRDARIAPVRAWDRFVDDGALINLAPLAEFVDDRPLAKLLREIQRDLNTDRYALSRTASCNSIPASTAEFAGASSRPPRRRRSPPKART
jgi:hypothetical protein